MKKRLRVMVLMGGKSPEYEVSLVSGREVVKNLDRKKYEISSLIIPKNGGRVQVDPKKTNVVFIAMHGPFGEDGTVQGSSVGTTIVKQKKDLKKALNKAFKYGSTAIVERYIKGTEVTCALLGNDNPAALPIIEIIPKNKYFDYDTIPGLTPISLFPKAAKAAGISYRQLLDKIIEYAIKN